MKRALYERLYIDLFHQDSQQIFYEKLQLPNGLSCETLPVVFAVVLIFPFVSFRKPL